jgi:hypothetical protein
MATSALPVVLDALYAVLDAAEIGAPVLRCVPQGPTYPYVTLRSATENRSDTFGRKGKTLLVQAHVYTSSEGYAGPGQALAILSQINSALEYAPLSLTGWDCLVCRPEDCIDAGAEVVDGVTYEHWVQTIRVEVMPNV